MGGWSKVVAAVGSPGGCLITRAAIAKHQVPLCLGATTGALLLLTALQL